MSDVDNIKYPNYGPMVKSMLLGRGTSPVSTHNARDLMCDHHFVLAWDGQGEPDDTCSVTLGILTSMEFTDDKTEYGIHTCGTNCDLRYDNAVFIHDSHCPEVLVKSEAGAFVGRLIGIDFKKGLAVVHNGEFANRYSISVVSYVDDINKDLLGIRKAPVEGSDNG